MRVCIWRKTTKKAEKVSLKVMRLIQSLGDHEVIVLDSPREMEYVIPPQESFDVIISVGGDGTFLRAAKMFPGVPIIGVNVGTVGFLTSIEPNDLTPLIDLFSSDSEMQSLITYHALESNLRGKRIIGVNDITVNFTTSGRPGLFEILINGEHTFTQKADGVIISTPIGSTAYNYAAKGPIISHELRVNVVTTICPFLSNHASIVIPEQATITIRNVDNQNDGLVFADGELVGKIRGKELIEIHSIPDYITMIKKGWAFYKKIDKRLHLSF